MSLSPAPLVIESVSPEPGTSYDLEDFKANITVSGTDIKPQFDLHYISDVGTTSVSRIGLTNIITYTKVYGSYSFGQNEAIMLKILPLTSLATFCEHPVSVDGNYTFTVVKQSTPPTAYLNFSVDISGRHFSSCC